VKVARAEAGSSLKVLGVADGWYRVELDSKRFAFARAADVKPAAAPASRGRPTCSRSARRRSPSSAR
jgi:hypothetical protein